MLHFYMQKAEEIHGSNGISSALFIVIQTSSGQKNRETLVKSRFFAVLEYGPGGNRTRVRKPIHSGISHHSHSFGIPSVSRRMTGLAHQ